MLFAKLPDPRVSIVRPAHVSLTALIVVLLLVTLMPVRPAAASLYVLNKGVCYIELNGQFKQMNGRAKNQLWSDWDCGARAAYEAWLLYGNTLGTVNALFESLENRTGKWWLQGSSLGEYYEGAPSRWQFGGLVCGLQEHRPFRCNVNALGVEFYSGDNCTGKNLGFFEADRQNFIYDDRIKNDEARSMYVYAVRPGTRIEIYDNPYGRTNDDWTSTTSLRAVVGNCIEDLNYDSFNDGLFDHQMHWKNGLAGKVSHIRIYVP